MGRTGNEWFTIAGMVLTIVLLEGLLSADNALVLAVMVRHLPGNRQRRALRYGIIGAFGFRFVAVLLATTILDFWQFEVAGGIYLLYLAITHLVGAGRESDPLTKPRSERGFWGTVICVELADIAFSIDSILAAVGVADELPHRLHALRLGILTVQQSVVFAGGVLGIIAMRFVAGCFLILLHRFRRLAAVAYYLVAWIGLKLIGEGLHHALYRGQERQHGAWRGVIPEWLGHHLEMPGWLFWTGMGLVILVSLLYELRRGEESKIRHERLGRRRGARLGPKPTTR
jgi:YkoY family integral membrane protein